MATADWDLFGRARSGFDAELVTLRPPDCEVLDVHTHLGRDEDGSELALATLLAWLDEGDVRRACVFPLHDPERRPAYRVPNDRVLRWAAESQDRLFPFCRLDPADDPLAEGERCLAEGARGIKLHPRAQAFAFADETVEGIFALAEQAGVPLLLHAGAGMPPIADDLVRLALRHPGVVLILAHAASADQGVLTTRLADHPGVLYDVSCLFAVDALQLFARAPAERIVFGSDPPYGHPATLLYMALRVAARAGLDEEATRAFLGGTMSAVLDGRSLPPPTPARCGRVLSIPGELIRVHTYCAMAASQLFARNLAGARGGLQLALAACRDPDPGPAAPALDVIGAAVSGALTLVDQDGGAGLALGLMHHAMARAVTERV